MELPHNRGMINRLDLESVLGSNLLLGFCCWTVSIVTITRNQVHSSWKPQLACMAHVVGQYHATTVVFSVCFLLAQRTL